MYITYAQYSIVAITVMVPNPIWAPDFIGHQEILAHKNLVLKKFWLKEILAQRNFGHKIFVPCMKVVYNNFYTGTKFRGDQISSGPNFLGTKKVRGPNEIRDHFSCSHYFECIKY